MKKILSISAALAVALSAAAQDVTEEVVVRTAPAVGARSVTSSFKSNWFIQAGAGPQVFFGDHDRQRKFGERISPALDIAVGKWFTPVIGVRVMYSGLYFKGATQNGAFQSGGEISGKPWHGYWLNESKVNFMNLHADVMLDLVNWIGGYNPNRVYGLALYAGAGFGYTWDRASAADNHHKQGITGNIGLFNMFHISKAFDINLDIRGMAIHDGFDGATGNRPFDALVSVTAGLSYRFGPRGFNNTNEVVTVYDNSALNDLRDRIAQLEARNRELQALAEKTQKVVVANDGSTYLAYFPINVAEVSLADRAQLEQCANMIKESDKNQKFVITGYADKQTGTPEINETLSRERAQNVRACLVKEFGIDPSRFEVNWKGGVSNMFYDDPSLSRVVVIKPKK